MADKPLKLFCYVLGFEDPFPVKAENQDTVGDLKKKIKAEMHPALDHLPASFLKLWQVSISNDRSDIAEEANRRIAGKEPLDATIEIIDEFRSIASRTIHVIAKVPYTASESERSTKRQKLDHNEKSDPIPPWLLNWHSVLWGKAGERPFSKTVTVTVDTYHELRRQLAGIPPQDHNQILRIKRDILNSLPLDSAPLIEIEDTDIVPAAMVGAVAGRKIDADITLPMRITYVDLLDLQPCDRIPQLVLYRPEFDELDRVIEQTKVELKDQAHYEFVTGTPGIGKTVYLHLQVVRMLLEARPFLYQTCDGDVFHFGEAVTKIGYHVPEHLISHDLAPHAFVDFDAQGAQTLDPSIRELVQGHIILASSPGPTISKIRKNQKPNDIWVLRNWESEEFWAALLFISPILSQTNQLRDAILHLGFNPRVCNNLDNGKYQGFVQAAITAASGVQNVRQLIMLLNRDKSPDYEAEHSIFDVIVGDTLHYYNAYLRPRSIWVLRLILAALLKSEQYERQAFHNLIASDATAGGFFGQFWEIRVHDYFRARQAKPVAFQLMELGTPNEIVCTLTIQRFDDFNSAEVASTLENTQGQMSYLQPLSVCYPTIDSLIYSQTPIIAGASPLLLLQMATNAHPLKVTGFKSVRDQLPLTSPLRPTNAKPWAIVFVVPDDRVHNFTKYQSLIGDADGFWRPKIRQFVLGLSRDHVYA